ncbi:unnamed protein product [Ilex paraguariensis]|uniref:Uncharacterized protein n=1 Tax=Ilex paraguariensis TaxID=185542 RepID=A0ABC8UN92_9AQUA
MQKRARGSGSQISSGDYRLLLKIIKITSHKGVLNESSAEHRFTGEMIYFFISKWVCLHASLSAWHCNHTIESTWWPGIHI